MLTRIKQTPPEGRVKAAKNRSFQAERSLLRLQVTLAQRDVTRAGRLYLATYTQRDLLDFATLGQEARGLGLQGFG